jgi:hypothetical protein
MLALRSRYPLAIFLAFVLMLVPVVSLAAFESPAPVSPGTGPQGSPRTDGQTVVWSDGREGIPFTTDVYGADLQTGTTFPIATGPANQMQPDVHGDLVVWSDDGVIWVKNLDTGDQFAVSEGPEDVLPAIYEHTVIWVRYDDTGVSLWSRNVLTMDAAVHLADFNAAVVDRPAISGDIVVWGEQQEEGPGAGWALYSIIADGTGFADIAASDDPESNLFGFDLVGTLLPYVVDDRLLVRDIAFEGVMEVATHAMMPTTDGRYVFWSDTRLLGVTDERVDLWGYDLFSDSRFIIFQNEGRNVLANAYGGYLVWSRGFHPEEINVHASAIPGILPTARRPDPMATSPDWRYFTVTGHYLSHGFKTFWERSGGLPIFGYPLTIEFDELNPDLDVFRTVQYTERQRFEYHPELAGTPYETLLGRLGARDAHRRGLTGTVAFQTVSFPAAGDPNCTFFPETGHKACFGFRDYWRSHGLDFGDPGVSFRESLALFGYPISREFTDPDTGLTTQYFERAVFEYHPDNPDPYKVLLRRLGAEELHARDW